MNETIETRGHATREGMLNLSVDVGLTDTEAPVVVQIRALPRQSDLDENGWPKRFFEQVAGSMPELERAPQGGFETRLDLE